MWDFINELYRDFCLARLQEMRKLEHRIWIGLSVDNDQRLTGTNLTAMVIASR